MKTRFFALCILAVSLGACRTVSRGNDAADVKFGHIVGWKDGTITSVTPGEKIHVCQSGASQEGVAMVHRALLDWAKAGGMSGGINAAVSCPEGEESAAIFVQLGGCNLQGTWAETLRAGAKRWIIKYCFPAAYTYDFALHEMGHVFGQCDRYGTATNSPHPVRGGNCSWEAGASDGVFEQPSAMQSGGGLHPQKVTEDDIRGVKALLARDDILGAKAWREFLSKDGGDTPRRSQAEMILPVVKRGAAGSLQRTSRSKWNLVRLLATKSTSS